MMYWQIACVTDIHNYSRELHVHVYTCKPKQAQGMLTIKHIPSQQERVMLCVLYKHQVHSSVESKSTEMKTSPNILALNQSLHKCTSGSMSEVGSTSIWLVSTCIAHLECTVMLYFVLYLYG